MLVNRRAHGAKRNAALKRVAARRNQGNEAWLRDAHVKFGVVLLGGNSLADFRVRVAQSHVRRDFLPSFWSLAGIMIRPGRVYTVPLDGIGDAGSITCDNGTVEMRTRAFDDPKRWPNIAVLEFASGVTTKDLDAVRYDRAVVDIPELITRWLAYVWGVGTTGNPLLDGHGIPSAAFVESVHTLARIDVTPGLASRSSCPEAIWQSAKWWRQFYEGVASGVKPGSKESRAAGPSGVYLIRQPAAAVAD